MSLEYLLIPQSVEVLKAMWKGQTCQYKRALENQSIKQTEQQNKLIKVIHKSHGMKHSHNHKDQIYISSSLW